VSAADPEIPAAWQDAAEEVRAHLCLLRGGGVFLSPADALQLVTWFGAGVGVGPIVRALERAAEARRRSRNRTPLSLVAAKRHLGKECPGWFHRDLPQLGRGDEPPLMPVVRALQAAGSSADAEARRALGEVLARVDGRDEEALLAAVGAARQFVESAWDGLGDAGRAALRGEAEAELGDLLALIDPHHRVALIEETARDRLRQRYPALTAATFDELLGRD
jgi:predicted component of type VI protein secretion system